jgi:FtsP/CotA-like multicopper oxidase with cupredoxin domain
MTLLVVPSSKTGVSGNLVSMDSSISRRQFLVYGSTAFVGLGARQRVGLPSIREVPRFRVPLPVPPVLNPVRSDATGDYYEIVQREATVEILPGIQTRIWGYNGAFPGPTIRARRGRAVFVTHTNRLSVPTVVHLHGGVTRPEFDGFPTDTIAPGKTRRYEYANTGRAATLWYHDHCRTGTGRSLYMGLAGLYLLEDDTEVNAQLPRDQFDIPLILQDRAFADDGEFKYEHQGHHGATGTIMLVNGAPWPVLEVEARKYRFRILNASNATPVRLALSPARPVIQIAVDQGLLRRPVSLRALDVTMAERVEIVIDFSSYAVGSRVMFRNLRGEGPLNSLMRFDVVGAGRDDSVVPPFLSEFETLSATDAIQTRTFVFSGRPTWGLPPAVQWVINGEPFDPMRVDASPRLGNVEVWRFVNRGSLGRTMLHPVHTHLAPFQVFRRNGRAPLLQEGGWKDTVAIDDGEEVEVLIRWNGYRGRYLLHCHNLEHEDHTMTARVDVI